MKKKNRPISRKFWDYLSYLPDTFQAWIIRSMFEVDYDLPKEIHFKQAETEDEIRQALKIVHDSYVQLNYMDRKESEMRFTKYHALPTTIMLVAKWGDEVIGTISIIPDSALGLPCDSTWDLSRCRANGQLIAEVSSLAIKKNYKMRRGKLLLPLCKIMYLYCSQILKVDGIVIATTLEVEPFYRHVLLFDKVVAETGQQHSLVKGNPSSCCFLKIDETLFQKYKKVYDHRPDNKNLWKFFTTRLDVPNILLPEPKKSLQSYNIRKNFAKAELMRLYPDIKSELTNNDKLIIQNLDVQGVYDFNFDPEAHFKKMRAAERFEVRFKAWSFFLNEENPVETKLIDVSDNGFQINLVNPKRQIKPNEKVVLVLEFHGEIVHCTGEIRWVKNENRLGCSLLEYSKEWSRLMGEIYSELHPNVIRIGKKIA